MSEPGKAVAKRRKKGLVIAIDGPAASGKGTIANELARRLGYLYLDTGAMYRAVALQALETGTPFDDPERLVALTRDMQIELEPGAAEVHVRVNGREVTERLRGAKVSQGASKIAVVPGVRAVLVAEQQRMGAEGGVVMEGRDIGNVVFPDAEVKIYLDASAEVRAERRRAQLAESGTLVPYEKMLAEIHERDERDRERATSPMGPAPDAVYLDSTALTIAEIVEGILEIARRRGGKR